MNGTVIVPQKREMIPIIKIIIESLGMVITILLNNTWNYIRSLF